MDVLTLKVEAKMHKLASNLYILALGFSVAVSISISFTVTLWKIT